MNSHDKISSLILTHWQKYQPTMLAQFQQENRLEAELEATAEQFAEMLYDLMVMKKMPYQSAWEMAIDEFFLPDEEESSLTSQNPNASPPATSE